MCCSWRTELEILNIQSEQQQPKEMTTYNLYSCLPSVWTACELRICCSWRTELEILNIQSEQQHQRDDNLRLANLHSCLTSVRTACELQFALRRFRSLEPKETNALNACNVKWPVYTTNTCPIHINRNRASKIVQLFKNVSSSYVLILAKKNGSG